MYEFPSTKIGDLSVARLVIGTNWFTGWSHRTKAKDKEIRETMTREKVADILEVYLRAGVNSILGVTPEATHINDAVKDAQDRVGREIIMMGTPTFSIKPGQEALDEAARRMDQFAEMGVKICMPHQNRTDALMDRNQRKFVGIEVYLKMIRERGMVPGLSTHAPEAPRYADNMDLDVETYIQIYNAAGFLMQIEIDWVHRMIWNSKKPVIAIKPLAAGRLDPLVGLAFVWATLRERDMVSIGTYSVDEAHEIIELSHALLERRAPDYELQRTRSKDSVDGKD